MLYFELPNELVEKPGGGWQTAPATIATARISSAGQFSWRGEASTIVTLVRLSLHAAAQVAIFSMLCTSVKSFHCASTFVRPRNVKRRMPLF